MSTPVTRPGQPEAERGGPASEADTPNLAAPFLVPLMSASQRVSFTVLAACWLLSLAGFWAWWLEPQHDVDTFRYALNCAVLFWTTVIPGYFVLVFSRARVPNRARAVPAGLRVAMVVTKAPSEPFEIVQTTLLAMLAQSYPHDTWLADEDPSEETIEWCARHGVQLSTRKDVADYHNASWPRRTRCKEGNLAYFYDRFGYAGYDFVAQLDADHVPQPGYLEAMLRPFSDPHVGYVSAPSICDSNASESWAARGRLHAEAALHGALQAGHNGGLAPLCIGSHYAVRTRALRDIGGLGPELAEDHSTTLMMNAHGWSGVHALDAIANGDGPRTFADMVTQEFQWSKSLAVILFRYTSTYFGRLPLRLKGQFLFAQLWYPLFSLTMAASVAMPVFALLTHRVWADVPYTDYLLHALPVTASILLLMAWVKTTGCLRPHNANVVSWEGLAFLFARWPWSLLGVLSAALDCVRGREFAFRVTPKSAAADPVAPMRVVAPYLWLVLFCALPVLLVDDADNARGFYVMSMLNALVYLVIAIVIVVAHARENGHRRSALGMLLAEGPLARRGLFVTAALVLVAAGYMRLGQGIEALMWRGDAITLAVAAEPPKIGAYDPDHAYALADTLDVEHIFVSWADPGAPAAIRDAGSYASQRKRGLMVTVEPWPAVSRNSHTLLRDVTLGAYDAEIDGVCGALRSLEAPVRVRWAQEMETATGRYPWAVNNPEGYIAAYRHFVDRCRAGSKSLRFVWSPRGDTSLPAYFPGRDYADEVGLSVFDCPTCAMGAKEGAPSATAILREKYARVQKYGLPVMVAELGVEGTPERQRAVLTTLRDVLPHMPALTAIVYFNSPDSPGAWPLMHTPDWRLQPALLGLLETAK
ncbi:glycosyl transferase [Caballeronia fortuita]|uniref:Glycosyl transferase n=1 Tax=Caballeronia fortuita TaxID=1777138 RepID=A0A157ZRS7_9BURK|nr:glycosyltransferase family 2 protein [Caballeronia fortuita]SAK48210.1 glycosyl transferase [Caballeronia fortuita]